MALETATYITQLEASNPSGSDRLSSGDDHLRLIKAVLKATFPNINAPVTATPAQLNGAVGSSIIPFGIMTAYYGLTAPAGWAICNGDTVSKTDGTGPFTTPDLRGQVIMGLPAGITMGVVTGQTTRDITTSSAGAHSHTGTLEPAGSHAHPTSTVGSHTLTIDQVPAHTHSFPLGNSDSNAGLAANGSVTGPTVATTSSGGGGPHSHALTVQPDGNHSHTATIASAGAHSHTATVNVTQPSAQFHIIIKV